ncbi:MAG: DUF6600 domain-containing protein [Candidatus Aminicenantales bacterium]
MKKRLWLWLPMIVLVFSTCIAWNPGYDRPYPRSGPYDNRGGPNLARDVSYFYDYLAPFGSWITLRPHGYVWIPRHMGYRWRPYADGRWVWTDYGWTWISEYEWGWVPFHYGRWGWDDEIGWYWVPGTVWGSAWVTWRTSSLYFGWAPLPPGVEFERGMGIRRLPFEMPGHFWMFVEGRDFLELRLGDRIIPPERNMTIIRNTDLRTNIYDRNNRIFNEGPDLNIVRSVTRRQIERHVVLDSRQAGPAQVDSGQVRIYRPDIRKDESARPKDTLDSGEARRVLGDSKIYEPPLSWQPNAGETDIIHKRHLEEQSVLERSQAGELRDLRQQFDVRLRRGRNAEERDKIQKELETTVTDLKSQHSKEKQALNERQKKDEESVRGRIRK